MTNEEFDEILERTNAVVCSREWYERAIKALEQEGYYKDLAQSYEKTIVKLTEAIAEQQPSDDCVSRQAVLAKINDWWGITSTSGEPTLCDYIRDLPPVTPTRKKGKWIFTKTIFDKYGCTVECPSCHKKWKTYDEIRWKKENKFCPNCGAEMESNACKDCYYNDGEVHAECVVCGKAEMESEE